MYENRANFIVQIIIPLLNKSFTDAVTDYIAPDAPIESNNVGRKLLESMGILHAT